MQPTALPHGEPLRRMTLRASTTVPICSAVRMTSLFNRLLPSASNVNSSGRASPLRATVATGAKPLKFSLAWFAVSRQRAGMSRLPE